MGIKNFLMKKLIGSKLKHLPKDQQDMILALVSENPEFFKDIQKQVDAKKKQGQDEQLAMMQVMRENQAQIQKLMMSYAQKQHK
jgi:mRNA-degrading endonuclease RelE of RelBE toxin-antitoxin system